MKKGFTLIELICVITILGLIALIAIPTINNMINKSREESYDKQLDNIIDAARTFVSDNYERIPSQNASDYECIWIDTDLQGTGIIEDGDIENPCYQSCDNLEGADTTNRNFTGGVEVRWNGAKYNYIYPSSNCS